MSKYKIERYQASSFFNGYLSFCPYAGQAFHFFLDKKTKQPART